MENDVDAIVADDCSGYLAVATQFSATSRYLLAIKAYARALEEMEDADSLDSHSEVSLMVQSDAFLRDFLLCCNASGVMAMGTNSKITEDCLRLCLEQLERRGCIQGSLGSTAQDEVVLQDQRDEGMLFLLGVTLNNWGCVLLHSGDIGRSAVFFRLALEASTIKELTRIILLNICALHIRNCCFPEAQSTAMKVLQEDDEKDEYKERNFCDDENAVEDVNGLLFAFAYHTMAIADEYLFPHEANDFYNRAKEAILESPYQQWSATIETSQRRFQNISSRRKEEMALAAAKKRELAEAENEPFKLLEGENRRKSRTLSKSVPIHQSRSLSNRNKKTKKNLQSVTLDGRDDPMELPPINGELRWKIRNEGLMGAFVPLLNVSEVRDIVFGVDEAVESPFAPLNTEILNSIAMVILYEETPFQIADKVEKGSDPRVRRTIWSLFSPRREEALVISPGKPTTNVAPLVAVTEFSKPFMPPPISEKVIKDAQCSVAELNKLLNHRLAVLLRAENAFEERWKATMVVKSALLAFNFAQDLIKLKATLKEGIIKRKVLESASARRIVHFFHMILEAKKNGDDFMRKGGRTKHLEEMAAIRLQKYARRWLAARELRRLQSERRAQVLQVVKVQGIYHSRVARRRYLLHQEEKKNMLAAQMEKCKFEFAAIQIQREYRRHARQLLKWRSEGLNMLSILRHYSYSRNYYATLIQKTFRGFLVRRIYGPVTFARRCYGRNCYRAWVLNRSARIIQKTFRGYMIRRATKGSLRQYHLQCARERTEVRQRQRHSAAVVIQCAYRSYLARNAVIELRVIVEKERLLRINRVYPAFRLEEQVY